MDGKLARVGGRGRASVRFDDPNRNAPQRPHAILQTCDIPLYCGPDVGVHDSGARTFELAYLGCDIAGSGDENAGKRRGDEVGDMAFMFRLGVAVQEGDRDGFDAFGTQAFRQRLQLGVIERLGFHPVARYTARHLEPEFACAKRRRDLLPQIEQRRTGLTPERQHVAETPVGHECDPGAAALEQGVRRDRRAVTDRITRRAHRLRQCGQRGQDRARRVVRRRRDLVGREHVPRRRLDEDVGESATDIHADPVRG